MYTNSSSGMSLEVTTRLTNTLYEKRMNEPNKTYHIQFWLILQRQFFGWRWKTILLLNVIWLKILD